MKRLIKASMLLMVAILFAACANEDIAQDKKEENGTEAPKGGVVFTTNDTKISAKRRFIDEDEFADAKTRTNIKHTVGQGADAYWTSDDFIWVKDKNGNWQQSTAITLNDGGASAEFTLPGSKTDYADGCEVRYTGPNSYVGPSAEYVTISNTATCTTPNDFSKAGDWGDCGSGTARNTGNPNKFNFTLEHKSAYLCFLPRCTDAALAPNVRLTSITITATKCYSPGLSGYIADCYDFDGENLSGSPYMLGTKSIVANISDFPLYTTANQTANATYMVVRPGKYDFKIDYTIKDPSNNVGTTVTQTLTNVTLNKGEINDITADLTVKEFSPNSYKYYMWDAPKDYWHNYENEQPMISKGRPGATQGQHYPQFSTDERWFNTGGTGTTTSPARYDAQTPLFQTFPNANELHWYVYKGDPCTGNVVYAQNGHLIQKGGLFLRRKSAIVAYLKANEGYPSTLTWDDLKEGYKTSVTAAPIDYRNVYNYVQKQISFSYAPPSDHFFLPFAGRYEFGWLDRFGEFGGFWSSSATPNNNDYAYVLTFGTNNLYVGHLPRRNGFAIQPFE